MVGKIVKEWDTKRIYVGCSGNFTIERSISNLISCPITSNDVTIYSSYIGKFFAGESLDGLQIKDEFAGRYQIFNGYMGTDVGKVATLIIASDMLSYDKRGEYFQRMYGAIDDISMKKYSGLNDETLRLLDKVSADSISAPSLEYQMINMLFLPSEVKEIQRALKEFKSEIESNPTLVARFEDYEAFMNTIADVGKGKVVKNTALTFMCMIRLAQHNIEQLKETWMVEAKPKDMVPISSILGRGGH